ncbi:MAG TPA: flavin reductase family protein [Acidimicrobiales bacterium]|nr:flavin reductase family protein [Acidimicrobiales bacterium]
MTGDDNDDNDELDRHRRRVLWAMPTGLYVIGSRAGDEVNLMTANLVMQVCTEPKLVAVAIESEAVTMRLVRDGGAFTVSLLPRTDRVVVRHFAKPVVDVEHSADGTVVTMSDHAVDEVGPHKLPVLASSVGYLYCPLTRTEELGSHVLCIGEVVEVGGEPSEVLRMEDTRMHYGG